MKPAVVAVLLDLDLTEYSGLPLDRLLSDTDKTAIEVSHSYEEKDLNERSKKFRKEMKRGSMKLAGLDCNSEEENGQNMGKTTKK